MYFAYLHHCPPTSIHCSLSIYNTALQNGWMNNSKGDISLGLGYIWGALAGSVGSYFSSPFFLVCSYGIIVFVNGIPIIIGKCILNFPFR